jgi:purine nucleoside phosphorylase
MSTVLETIAARALGLDVLGISLISNTTGGHVSHEDVSARLARRQRTARDTCSKRFNADLIIIRVTQSTR